MSSKVTSQENEQAVVDELEDEQDVASTDEGLADGESSKQADKSDAGSSKTSSEQAELDHKEKVYEGMIESYVTKVVMAKPNESGKAFTLEDIRDEKMRQVVSDRIRKAQGSVEPTVTNEERIAQRVREGIDLDSLLSPLDEVERDSAKTEYANFRKNGDTHESAQQKTKRLFGLLSPREQAELDQSYGQRAHKVGRPPAVDTDASQETSAIVSEMAKYGVSVKPESVKKVLAA